MGKCKIENAELRNEEKKRGDLEIGEFRIKNLELRFSRKIVQFGE